VHTNIQRSKGSEDQFLPAAEEGMKYCSMSWVTEYSFKHYCTNAEDSSIRRLNVTHNPVGNA
jgi:hypothetical protein